MASWIASFLIVFLSMVALTLGLSWSRRRSRAAAVASARPPLREAIDVSVKLTVDKDVAGTLRPGRAQRSPGHLRLAADRLVLATNQGRVLEISAEHPGTLRAPGPRMLILEGSHPSGRANVRAELLLDDEQGWLAEAGRTLGDRAIRTGDLVG